VKIEYVKQMIFIKFILTYKEYDKEQWKNAC
jgi:mRNA-degrading endonuclease HigB of HigAB toxin-antitoxin module